jgi:hypothetical protein
MRPSQADPCGSAVPRLAPDRAAGRRLTRRYIRGMRLSWACRHGMLDPAVSLCPSIDDIARQSARMAIASGRFPR